MQFASGTACNPPVGCPPRSSGSAGAVPQHQPDRKPPLTGEKAHTGYYPYFLLATPQRTTSIQECPLLGQPFVAIWGSSLQARKTDYADLM